MTNLKEKQHSVNTKVGSTLHRALRMRAAREDVKLKDLISAALAQYIAKPPQQKEQ